MADDGAASNEGATVVVATCEIAVIGVGSGKGAPM